MPLLLEDLAEETTNTNEWAAGRLGEEVRMLDESRQTLTVLEERRQNVVERAREATEYAIARVPQLEGVWRSGLAALHGKPTVEGAVQLLQKFQRVFESGTALVRAVRPLWQIAAQLGAEPEKLDELARAEQRLEELASDVQKALKHRTTEWHPSDPERLAQGVRLARECQTLSAEAARAGSTEFRIRNRGKDCRVAYVVEFVVPVLEFLDGVDGLKDDDRKAIVEGVAQELSEDADRFLALYPLAHESLCFRYEYLYAKKPKLYEFQFVAAASYMAMGIVRVAYVECVISTLT